MKKLEHVASLFPMKKNSTSSPFAENIHISQTLKTKNLKAKQRNYEISDNEFHRNCANSFTRISTDESIQSPSLPLESVNHIHGGHRLLLGVLSVGHSIVTNVFQEDLQYSSGLLVDQPSEPLHSTFSSKTSDSRLSDALNVVTENFPMTLCVRYQYCKKEQTK